MEILSRERMDIYIGKYSIWKYQTWDQWRTLISDGAGVLMLDIKQGMLADLTDGEIKALFDYCRDRSFCGNPIGLP